MKFKDSVSINIDGDELEDESTLDSYRDRALMESIAEIERRRPDMAQQRSVIHIAGEYIGGQQRCVRCSRVLIDNRHIQIIDGTRVAIFTRGTDVAEVAGGFCFRSGHELRENEVPCSDQSSEIEMIIRQ
ncbi:MAG TPA: hypothetical protein VF747_06600 [Blastocatellia bacterium]